MHIATRSMCYHLYSCTLGCPLCTLGFMLCNFTLNNCDKGNKSPGFLHCTALHSTVLHCTLQPMIHATRNPQAAGRKPLFSDHRCSLIEIWVHTTIGSISRLRQIASELDVVLVVVLLLRASSSTVILDFVRKTRRLNWVVLLKS